MGKKEETNARNKRKIGEKGYMLENRTSLSQKKKPKAIQDKTSLWSTPSFTVICESPYEGRNLVICISEG